MPKITIKENIRFVVGKCYFNLEAGEHDLTDEQIEAAGLEVEKPKTKPKPQTDKES